MTMKFGSVPGIEKPISRLVQGTASYDTDDVDGMFTSLDTALELGFNTFDTAECYGPVKEKLFGKWMSDRGVREKVVVLAKGAHPKDRARVTPQDITADLTQTLALMETETVELYVLHRDDPSVPVGPIVDVLNEHKNAGRIQAFGGSNWSAERIESANAYAAQHGLTPFAVSSPNFSLAEQVNEPWGGCLSISGPHRQAERDYYASKNTPLFTWSSLAGGFWTGLITRESKENQGGHYNELAVRCYGYEQNYQRLDRVIDFAKTKGLSVPQVALAYVMSFPLNIFALVFCADRAQFEANSAALDVNLTENEMAWLDLRADSLS